MLECDSQSVIAWELIRNANLQTRDQTLQSRKLRLFQQALQVMPAHTGEPLSQQEAKRTLGQKANTSEPTVTSLLSTSHFRVPSRLDSK